MYSYANDRIQLSIDNKEIGLNKFTSNILRETILGMVTALKTPSDINDLKTLTIKIEKINPENMNEAEISLNLNNNPLKINDFVCGIIKETIYGMIKSLNTEKFGVEKIDTIIIKIKK